MIWVVFLLWVEEDEVMVESETWCDIDIILLLCTYLPTWQNKSMNNLTHNLQIQRREILRIYLSHQIKLDIFFHFDFSPRFYSAHHFFFSFYLFHYIFVYCLINKNLTKIQYVLDNMWWHLTIIIIYHLAHMRQALVPHPQHMLDIGLQTSQAGLWGTSFELLKTILN